MLPRPLTLALLASLALSAPSSASPQGGWDKRAYPEIGITLPEARDYEQIPTQPDEEHVVLHYAEDLPADPKKRKQVRPSLHVVWIDWVPDPPPKVEAPPAAPAPDADEGRTKATPKAAQAEPPPPPPINGIERFLEQQTGWQLGRGEPGKARAGWTATLHSLVPKPGGATRASGWCYVYEQPKKRTVAFLGTCYEGDLEDQAKIWKYVAEHADRYDPAAADLQKLTREYASKGLRGADYRVSVRSKMVRGWKAEDTENFIVVYHTKDQPLVRQLCSDVESIRKEYLKLFPPAVPIEAVSTVRVCKDRAEYLAYGGWPSSAGYWNSETEELVFFDASVKEKGKRETGEENTFIVLYHEAFHQYIHYSSGELPPHSWFNEGHGDFFSGADIRGGKVKRIGVNPWRIRTIQGAIAERRHVPLKDIVRFEQPEYYRGDRVGICYAQGWSMIYFLRTSPVVQKHPRWSKILDEYFVALKDDYRQQLDLLEKQGRKDDRAARAEAGLSARKYALERAFLGVDYDELEREWIEFTSKIEFKAE
jgi:hypothetical protein